MSLPEWLARIAARDVARYEATLQADIRQSILSVPSSLSADDLVTADLGSPVGPRRRIGIEVGNCLIEVKRDLVAGNTLAEATDQLGGLSVGPPERHLLPLRGHPDRWGATGVMRSRRPLRRRAL
jgi:hypothetical protein